MMEILNKRELQQIASNHSSDTDFKDFIKLNKDHTKEPYPFLLNDTNLSYNNPLRFRKTLLQKWVLVRNLKQSIKKLTKTKLKISALSSWNISRYEFLTGKDVLMEKYLLLKATTMKRFEYLPLGKELKAQTDVTKKNSTIIRQYFGVS